MNTQALLDKNNADYMASRHDAIEDALYRISFKAKFRRLVHTIRSWNPCNREKSVVSDIIAWRAKMEAANPSARLKLIYRVSPDEARALAAELGIADIANAIVAGARIERQGP